MTAGPQWLKSGLQVLGLGSAFVATDQTINLYICVYIYTYIHIYIYIYIYNVRSDVAEKYVAIICCMVSI